MRQGFTAAISLIYNAKIRLQVFKKEKGVSMNAKHLTGRIIYILDRAINTFRFGIEEKDWKLIEKEILNTDSSLQIENLIDLVLGLDQEGRDTVELFIEALKKGEVEVA